MSLLNYNDFLTESRQFSTSWVMENILNEGGAYGHLEHPFEDFGLTMNDLQQMINTTVNGAFGPENFVQEKCLSGDSKVILKSKGEITISELVKERYEDDILSLDSNGNVIYNKILDWVDNDITNDWLIIELEDGKTIKVTPNHRIILDGYDVKAEELKLGDELVTI